MFVGGQEFHKLKPSNCKGFKNTNLVISSTTPDLFRSFLCLQAKLHSKPVEKTEILAIIRPSIYTGYKTERAPSFFVACIGNPAVQHKGQEVG